MIIIKDLRGEIINLKEIIMIKLQDNNTTLANKVVKLKDKIKNLEIQTNNSDQYKHRTNVEVSHILEVVNGENPKNAIVKITCRIQVRHLNE